VVLSNTGLVLAPFEFRGPDFNFSDQAVIAAIAGESGFVTGARGPDLNGQEQEWIAYAMPVERDGTQYIIYTRMSARPMNDSLSQLTEYIVMMLLMVLLITVLLWVLFASTLSRPIVNLTRHAKEMAQGHVDKEISVHSRDEIGQLTESFNHMAQELNTMVSTLALEKNKHETVLHNMADGVLAYDAQGFITHANSTAGALLQFDGLEKQSLAEMLPLLGFDPEEVKALGHDQVIESTLAVNDHQSERYISACCSPFTNQLGAVDGFVIVLQDITKHTRLDNMRREFVANVSHELRTPLASICSYAETLLNGVDERDMSEQFLRVIDTEAKRMSQLVTDLLELSRLDEDNPADMEMELVDLVGLTKMAMKHCHVSALEKEQRILFEEPGKPYFIEAAAGPMNQVLTNIISNSIKYSPAQTDIEVAMEETDRYYRVMIRDHGMGIAKEHLSRIFERFYRVDKARSRLMGGTGLGLAIAKEIMEAHGGRITATSDPGSGTVMVLRFNKYADV
jgi:two-component system sensor histidine kinase VicK